MPGENCSIYGCSTSRYKKYKGIPIIKVPGGSDEFETEWRNDIVAVVLQTRELDKSLRDQIRNKRIYVCGRHFKENEIIQCM